MSNNTQLSFEHLRWLKSSHPSIKLLNADHLPLIVSFLYKAFILPNKRTIAADDLTVQLDDYLHFLHQTNDESNYPKSAKYYLNEWTDENFGFLRKFYPKSGDEAVFDITPATEKAIEWLQSLQEKSFVGTESRLLTMLQILRDIVQQTETDPNKRIYELEKQKKAIESEIAQIQQGSLPVYNATQIKERFIQAEDTGKKLLGDFRQVQYNFRQLDQQTREKIVSSDKQKGELLSEVFQDHDIIRDSDQGKSFNAFWEFLMSPQRQQELSALLEHIYELEEIAQLQPDRFLKSIYYALLDAGESVYNTHIELAEQLRRYLDDQTYLENKRLMHLIQSFEKRCLDMKKQEKIPAMQTLTSIQTFKADIDLLMCRGLFQPPKNPVITEKAIETLDPSLSLDVLFEQVYVDENILRQNIQKCLANTSQVYLSQIIHTFPVKKGLAELVSYLKIASNSDYALFKDEVEVIQIQFSSGKNKNISIPKILFVQASQTKTSSHKDGYNV
ncbi:DUF3375 domain-containing protein [Facilibium subflavum]|uniref:DUF3375 domain-containing protein n=1 Tax=Facilibium subflavum TaxID=2219058 RepID=UPI000E6563CC|nr:DUF3375 domain-containing protein [Facilibium subflavum]